MNHPARYAAELLSRFVSAVHLALFLSSPSGPLVVSDFRSAPKKMASRMLQLSWFTATS
jgi:hypothetical protein